MISSRIRLLIALVASVAAVAINASSAFAAAEEVAYSCGLDICLVDPDNPAAVVNLTDNGNESIDQKAEWSPNGARLAFVSNFGSGVQNIFVMQPGAPGEAVNLAIKVTHYTTNTGVIDGLVWSPDGTRIAFTHGFNPYGLFVAAADGTSATPVPIAAETTEHASWSPDGSKLVYSKPNGEILLGNANGSGSATLFGPSTGHDPYWSPNGAKIAFDAYKENTFVDLHMVNANGIGTPVIVADVPTEWTFPAWSPDSGRIAYRHTEGGGRSYYRVINADGSGDHALPNSEEDQRNVSWSPDGSRLVYEARKFSDSEENVYVVNADGSGVERPITTGTENDDPVWRPIPSGLVPQVPPPSASAPGKPKVVWFTKRVHITPGGPIDMLSVGCGGPTCGVVTTGTARYVGPPSTAFRLASVSKKPKPIVVGTGKLHLRQGQTKTLFMHLNKSGKALLVRQGKLDIQATVKITTAGQATVTTKRTIHVVLAKPKHGKHRHGSA